MSASRRTETDRIARARVPEGSVGRQRKSGRLVIGHQRGSPPAPIGRQRWLSPLANASAWRFGPLAIDRQRGMPPFPIGRRGSMTPLAVVAVVAALAAAFGAGLTLVSAAEILTAPPEVVPSIHSAAAAVSSSADSSIRVAAAAMPPAEDPSMRTQTIAGPRSANASIRSPDAAPPIHAAVLAVPPGWMKAGWVQALTIASGTFVSEDLTCIATGLLIRRREIIPLVGLMGCILGIYLGDLGLWTLGRVAGRRLLGWRPLARRLPLERLEEFGRSFDRSVPAVVIASRFLPGTRLPIYLAAGIFGTRPWAFVLWTLLAALLWTPLLVLLVVWLGEAFVVPFERLIGAGGASLAAAALALFLSVRTIVLACTADGRSRLAVSVSRFWRWEFWPVWVFYLPLAPWIAYLSIRHRGFTTITAANPGIPDGGFVGESKNEILRHLPRELVAPFFLVGTGRPEDRAAYLRRTMETRGLRFPIILKPDAGQRGAGVRLVQDEAGARAYFATHETPVLAQAFDPGPYEAGIFYVRMPDEPHGRIFSITDKLFPVIEGDGASTLEELVKRHTRYRMQAATFLARHEADRARILARGERFPLAIAGNHCQGTMFRDGSHLITPALERAIDTIAKAFDGFFFGRFDVRYADPAAFREGRDFTIVELNGVTSESTDIYDPSRSLLSAYRTLFRQWALLFRIGAINRRRGVRTTPAIALLRATLAHYRSRPADLQAD